MPARVEEVHHAKEEGIIFKMLCNPVQIEGDRNGYVKRMQCIEMELGEPDASGRRRPVPKPGSEFEIDVDTVVVAIGNSPNRSSRALRRGSAKQGIIGRGRLHSKKGVYVPGGDGHRRGDRDPCDGRRQSGRRDPCGSVRRRII